MTIAFIAGDHACNMQNEFIAIYLWSCCLPVCRCDKEARWTALRRQSGKFYSRSDKIATLSALAKSLKPPT